LIERVWLILNLEEGEKDEPEEIHARTDYWDASGSRGAAFSRTADGRGLPLTGLI